jgi:hypothetical protein
MIRCMRLPVVYMRGDVTSAKSRPEWAQAATPNRPSSKAGTYAKPYRFVAKFRDGKRRRRKGDHPAWAALLDSRLAARD